MFSKRTTQNRYTGPATLLPNFILGVVTDVNPAAYTADVRIEGSGYLPGVPILNLYGSSLSRDVTWVTNFRGATVVLITLGSESYILGTVPTRSPSNTTLDTDTAIPIGESGFGGGHVETYQGGEGDSAKGVLKNYQGGRPVDFLPGDKIIQVDGGVGLGLFREGIIKLKASPLVQFVMFKYRGLSRLVSRAFQFFSDFGEMEVGQKSGKTYARLSGGADFAGETHPQQAKWTIQVWAGDSSKTVPDEFLLEEMDSTHPIQNTEVGDQRLYIRVNDLANQEYSLVTMDVNGNMLIKLTGEDRKLVKENKIVAVEKNSDEYVKEAKFTGVGTDENDVVVGDKSTAIVGSWDVSALGSASIGAQRSIEIQSMSVVNIRAPKINLN